jgi:hypothetical protein
MKLFQHKDFEQGDTWRGATLPRAQIAPRDHEDYYVTEALRTIAAAAPDKIIFKGGTSLAKGRNLIQRFQKTLIFSSILYLPRMLSGASVFAIRDMQEDEAEAGLPTQPERNDVTLHRKLVTVSIHQRQDRSIIVHGHRQCIAGYCVSTCLGRLAGQLSD